VNSRRLQICLRESEKSAIIALRHT
jgi:hypothetical protein